MAKLIPDVDFAVQSVFANQLALLAAGLVEETVSKVLSEYGRKKGDPKISRYITKSVEHQNSLSCEKIKLTLDKFDGGWWDQLEDRVKDSDRAAIDSLKAIRDKVAHGRPNGTGFSVVGSYYSSIKRFAREFDQLILEE
ncbi:HEPN domain-containing protein [Wenxinia saemankumensis]|uniref:RiboL-PSP-HEPN domain-containing protein n=1 Tax=Wenxinia saemankumensis TaxID=1447782 RepID=A0A1M6G818_9RHOB|nr:HEPN domain-containing protein [Wenxinia saemankumensis]SHJ06079.1 hypothetical protein SAMN05444417_2737 [Wenxinia saemankumensis]